MGNSDSKTKVDTAGSDQDEAEGDIEAQKTGGEEETKGSSRPGTGTASRATTPGAASVSSADSDDELDEEEKARRVKLDIRKYEYDPEQVEELIMMSGSTRVGGGV